MLLPWLRLFRIAGLTTIVSNIIAVVVTTGLGSLDIVREIGQHFPNALWVSAASVFIYLSGMIWNDSADVERDKLIAPKRPLPSGRIRFINAWVIGVLCVVLAIMCASQLGWRGFYTASFVLCCALSYNFGAKHIPWLGSLVMALTRASHACFALLMLGHEHFDVLLINLRTPFSRDDLLGPGILGLYPILLGMYIFALTLISELEDRKAQRWELVVGSGILILSLLIAIFHNVTTTQVRDMWVERNITGVALTVGATVLVGGWAIWRLVAILYQAIRLAKRNLIGPFMIRGLSGIIVLDTIVVLGFRPELAPLVIVLLLPFFILGRLARMD